MTNAFEGKRMRTWSVAKSSCVKVGTLLTRGDKKVGDGGTNTVKPDMRPADGEKKSEAHQFRV